MEMGVKQNQGKTTSLDATEQNLTQLLRGMKRKIDVNQSEVC